MLQTRRIILVLYNRLLRDGICVLLGACEDLELVAVAATIDDLKPLFTSRRPDLVLMDLDLPARNALDGIKQIQDLERGAWIIGLATHEEEEHCAQAIEVGAATVIAKDLIGKVLVPLIRDGRPMRGESYEHPSVHRIHP
jgi:DNA-binding NarL/FixJ family response regulator